MPRSTKKGKKKKPWPPKYFSGLTRKQARAREKEIQRFGSMNWKDPHAYVGFATDKIPTRRKKSSYTLQWQSLYPKATSLKQRAAVTGVPLPILDAVFRRGSAAWRSSELPAPRAAAAKGLSSSVGYFNWFHMEFVRFED